MACSASSSLAGCSGSAERSAACCNRHDRACLALQILAASRRLLSASLGLKLLPPGRKTILPQEGRPSEATCSCADSGKKLRLIGEVAVTYTPRHAIPKQRRYADGPCIFKLPKKARFAAAHGLYVDGDLVGSELVSLQHACHMHRCDCSLMRSECPMAL